MERKGVHENLAQCGMVPFLIQVAGCLLNPASMENKVMDS